MRFDTSTTVDEGDPLDTRVGPFAPEPGPGLGWRLRNRLALGLQPTLVPTLLLLPLGLAVGPSGINLLSRPVLAFLEPAVAVALAALGIFVGFGLRVGRPREARLLGVASVEAGLTIVLVGVALWLVQAPTTAASNPAPWLLALLAGVCASASATIPMDEAGRPSALVTRIGDLDDVLPIVLGGVAVAMLREPPLLALWLTAQAVVVAVMTAIGGWLLVSRASSDSEQRVFAFATLLLLGGSAQYLSLSALLAGLVAGACWNAAAGSAAERISRDLAHVQHPLMVLLLLVAGAHVDLTVPGALWLAGAYVIFRAVAKLAAGWLAGRMLPGELPRYLGFHLLSPGVIAVAFALNVLQAAGPDRSALLLAVAVCGSIGSDLLRLVVRPAWTHR